MNLHCVRLSLLLSSMLSVIQTRTPTHNIAGPLNDLWSEAESWEQTDVKKKKKPKPDGHFRLLIHSLSLSYTYTHKQRSEGALWETVISLTTECMKG